MKKLKRWLKWNRPVNTITEDEVKTIIYGYNENVIEELRNTLTDDEEYICACMSSINYIFTYINVLSMGFESFDPFYTKVLKCINDVHDNPILLNGFRVMLYHFASTVTKDEGKGFYYLNHAFNVVNFKTFLRYRFENQYTNKFGNGDLFKKEYECIIKDPISLYKYMYNKIFGDVNARTAVSIFYGVLLLYYIMIEKTSQASTLHIVKQEFNNYFQKG